MNQESHNSTSQLEKLIRRINELQTQYISVSTKTYRSISPKYSQDSDILSGKGSKFNGGRWNPIGIAAIYASLTPETAMAETLSYHRYRQIDISNAMPRLFVAINVNAEKILNLTDGKTRQILHISQKRLVQCDWRSEVYNGNKPITQILGEAAYQSKMEGLLTTSSVDRKSLNLILFPDNILTSSKIELDKSVKMSKN